MGLFSNIKKKFNNKVDNYIHSKLLNIWNNPPENNPKSWEILYHKNPRMNPVRRIAQDIAAVEWIVKDKDNNILEDTIFNKLLKNPNPLPWMTWTNINYIKEVHLLINGEAFWVLERDEKGKIEEIWVVPPSWVYDTPSNGRNYYIICPENGGEEFRVDYQDMVYFVDPNISSPYNRGVGQVQQIGDEIETDEYMAKYSKKFFYNDAVPPIIIQAPGAQSGDIKRLELEWNKKSKGLLNAYKARILPWDAKVQMVKETSKEMDFIASRKFIRDVAIQNFNIPPEIMGIVENSNRATIDAAYTLYARNVLNYRLSMTQDVFNNQLIADKDIYIEHKNIIPEDKEFNLKISNDGFANGALTKNEWRIANGYTQIKDGDVYHIPINVYEVSASDGNKSIIKKKMNENEKYVIWKNFDNAARKLEKGLEISMNKFFEEQAARTSKNLLELYATKAKKSRKDNLPQIILDSIFLQTVEDEELQKILLPFIVNSSKNGIDESINIYNFNIQPDFVENTINEYWEKYAYIQAKNINEETQKMIGKEVQKYLDEGLSIRTLADNISNKITDIGKGRAKTIARTETHNATQGGVFETYKAAEIEYVQWLTSRDERVRDSHAALDGQIIQNGKLFSNGLKYPGDTFGSVEEFVNCRCVLLVKEE